MDIRSLTATYAVSPQIDPQDITAIKDAGFALIIDNRPDHEIPATHHAQLMEQVAREAGIGFVINPVIGGQISPENVQLQAEALAAAQGPVLAYCASGNRCSIVWALAHVGTLPTDDLIAIPARFGYQLEGLRAELDAMLMKKSS